MTADWILLSMQVVASVIALFVLRTMLLPAMVRLEERSSVRDVWLPLVLVGPALFAAAREGDTVGSAAWLATGLPVIIGFVAIGMAMVLGVARSESSLALSLRTLVIWTLSGIVFLLLCAVNELSIWTGQTAFAAGAVVVWLNTPDVAPMSAMETQRDVRRNVFIAVPVLLACAVCQGMAILHVSGARLQIAALLFVVTVVIGFMFIARGGGRSACVRIGGWVAAYGVLFGIGLTSFLRMLPVVWQSMRTLVAGTEPVHAELQPSVVLYVAHGYGWLSVEAVMMLAFAGAVVGAMRIAPRVSRIMGGLILAGIVLLIGWRLLNFFPAG